MRKIFDLLVILGIITIIFAFGFGYVEALADDLQEDIEEIQEDTEEIYQSISDTEFEIEEDGFNSFEDDIQEDPDKVLHDYIFDFKSVKSVKGLRDTLVNTYDSSKTWLFDESYYLSSSQCGLYKSSTSAQKFYYIYIFPDNVFGDSTYDLVNTFYNSLSGSNECFLTVNNYYVFPENRDNAIPNIKGNQTNISKFITNNGIPSEGTIWEEDIITPDPTPTVDPTPTPDPTPTGDPSITPTPDPSPQEPVYMENKPDMIVLIFAVGLIFGFLFGRVFLGFVK